MPAGGWRVKITPRNLILHEFIGLEIEVAESTNECMRGLSGIVVDETKNMFVIEKGGVRKKIPKRGNVFLFKLEEGNVLVRGDILAVRPEDRIKKLMRKAR
ncbi:MAG: RNase P/RNase MRP subunit p29 [Candidatus Alkanophagales archaeon MCA70_species_1]|nr:RNase P/RNase MRP subunit p29 [Candidatus Alkanophaga volatiphilum]